MFEKIGFTLVPHGGKGSHLKLKKEGRPKVIIPNHRELSKGTECYLLKVLKREIDQSRKEFYELSF